MNEDDFADNFCEIPLEIQVNYLEGKDE